MITYNIIGGYILLFFHFWISDESFKWIAYIKKIYQTMNIIELKGIYTHNPYLYTYIYDFLISFPLTMNNKAEI
jgi:hypothetical protein